MEMTDSKIITIITKKLKTKKLKTNQLKAAAINLE
jgi:hypothetical protein